MIKTTYTEWGGFLTRKEAVMGKQQGDLPGMPERTPLGQKAIEYLNVKEDIENKQDEMDKVKAELVQLFLSSGVSSIKVEGHTVTYSRVETDKITTKQAVEA